MKIAITSDIHNHYFKDFDRLTKDGRSFRLSLYEKSLWFVWEYCKKNGINYWVDAGDFFHSRESITLPVLDMVGNFFSECEEKESKSGKIFKYFLKGNHDTNNKVGDITSLSILSKYGKVIKNTSLEGISLANSMSCFIKFIPWGKEDFVEQVNNSKSNLVIAHRMLKGSKVNNTILDGESLKGLDYSKFDNIFCGHVHEYQKIQDNVYYVGSLVGNNFNDKDQDKGFIVYNFETKNFEKIKNPYSPNYKVINFENLEELKHYQEVVLSTDTCFEVANFYDFRVKLKIGEELPKINGSDLNIRITNLRENKGENRIDFDDILTPESLLKKHKKMNNLNESVYKVGEEILKECLIQI
jgi:DNA repair exonuclease SbcCD nuclease subunit